MIFRPLLAGSSPLSRGILSGGLAIDVRDGIIPALAGNTSWLTTLPRLLTDHPRSRGEYLPSPPLQLLLQGSSPLSRGIRTMPRKWGSPRGIIPALAGNTASFSAESAAVKDHPRSRGEYKAGNMAENNEAGSSPLSRGILLIYC